MNHSLRISLVLLLLAVLAACAPTASSPATVTAQDITCHAAEAPTVAIVGFQNTTGGTGGLNVIGVEEAAVARLTTLMVNSGCYRVIEKSHLQRLIEEQGFESLDPVELARAAGAAYVITGVVTRATLDQPSGGIAGFGGGLSKAQVSVDVRATDAVTGAIAASVDARGEATSPQVNLSGVPLVGQVSMQNPSIGPIFADAAEVAMVQVVREFAKRF